MITVKRIENKTEKEQAFEIRQKVFVEEQCVDPALEYDEFEDTSTHYIAYFDSRPAGTCRWRKTDKGIKMERFAVLKEFRNKGVGEALLKQALEDVPKTEGKIYLHAQTQVIPFYEKYGFKTFGDEFEEANIMHFKMQYSAS
jgi:predicted GNAT family N-acyltransferase